MDSFFKAAVCDLDKLLDDFEHNTEEPDCKSVFLKPPAYSLSTLGSQSLSSEASTGPQKLPDLNSLHYGFSPISPDRLTSQNHNSGISEVEGQQLTDVDLLSSVDRRQVKGCVPPCPDRALKPVCDLVNDTSSAIRGSSHDTFGELDMVEKQMEEEEALLVDFSSPVVAALGEEVQELSFGDMDTEIQQASAGKVELPGLILCDTVGGYSASLSLLDVILPAAIERVCESADESMSKRTTELAKEEEDGAHKMGSQQSVNSLNHCEQVGPLPENPTNDNITTEDFTKDKTHEQLDSYEADSLAAPTTSENDPVGLSCFPIAVSMCGALVNSKNSTEGSVEVSAMGKKTEMPECKEADSVSTLTARMDGSNANELINIAVPFSLQPAEGSASTNEEPVSLESPYTTTLKHTSSERAEPSTAESVDFGFEYLPEPDQAELLVTDEELDAFLQAHSGAEHFDGGFLCSMSGEYGHHKDLSDLSGDLEQKLVEEELRSRGQQDTPENMNSPEKEMTSECVEESLKPKLSSFSPDLHSSYQIEPEISSQVTHSINPIQSQHSVSPDLHSYGGARPKQLHCLVSPSPAETGLPVQMFDSVTDQSTVEDEENPASPCHPPPSHSSNFEPGLVHEPHRNHNNDGYDELSEPPPYPGEPSGNDANSMDETEEGLGCRQPAWVPDSEAPNCMNCTQRFTFTKRRHHCRACGKVFCAVCCSRKCKLKYLEKEARVCLICFDTIHRAQALERMMSPTGPSPNPNVPSEYCSTIPPLQQARAAGTLNSPPPTVMVPVSVLKHPTSDGCPREQKRVWFADGILPNGEVADTTKLSVTGRRSPQECSPVATEPPAAGPGGPEVQVGGSSAPESSGAEGVRPPLSGPWDYALLCGINSSEHKGPSLLPDEEEELPPLLITTGDDEVGDVLVEERPAPCQILLLLEEGGPRPLTFLLNATLLINVKLVTYCSRRCWCFGSNGLRALGQRELAFVLECLPDEKTLPKDLFMLYLNIYQDAQKGKFVEDLGNVTFTSSFLGSKEHGGMLFFSPTCQPLEDLSLPPQPFLFGLLIQRLEVPWAKVFPLRLLLRLGAEHSMYPTTTVSIRFRESVYRETGHTIMNLLADLRNYQYSLPVVEGLRIHMEVGHSYIDIPKSSYNEMLKVVNSSNEHVISVGASLSLEADSHLVCFQNDDGNYQTQSNSMPGKNRTVTGASFVVFNGALKASSGFIAKSSIVEDGLMVQIPPDTMEALRTALREKTDFLIPCGRSDAEELRENVTVRWLDWTAPVNVGVTSGVDGRSLAGVQSVRMQQDTEFESEGHSMRCTEVFYQLRSPDVCLATVLSTCDGFQREMALATCSALSPHLAVLASSGINSLSLRFSTQSEMVQYQAGSRSQLLPQRYMNELDSALIPVIHGGSASVPQIAMDMEFHFYITNAI